MASGKVVLQTAEVTGELLGNKTAENIIKPKIVSDDNSGNFEETVIPPKNN